ncbi:MAG: cellulase family glycosylhydrolase [Myxococcales bacterium]
MHRVWTRLLGLLLCALSAAPARAVTPAQNEAFVRVQGTHFVLGDQPFRFVGANVSVMHGPNERKSYEAVLDAAVADGLSVVRLWALGEIQAPGEPYQALYAFRIGENGWLDASFVHLDRVLVAARARRLRVIVVLANRWKDYGGIASYLHWAGEQLARDTRNEPLGSAVAAFYDCGRCQTMYREHLSRVVGRINSVSQVAYRDDPTIFAWELINEASATSAREEESMLRWVRQSAQYIRSIDPNHLISAGHIGYKNSRERKVWRAVQSLPEVDFADLHVYPQNDMRVENTAQLTRMMDDPIALAELVVKKPLVFGEFGFERKRAYVERVRWTTAFLEHALKRGAAGALIWLYEPSDNPRRTHSITVHPSDLGSRRVRRVLSTYAQAMARKPQAGIPASWNRTANLPQFAPPVSEHSTRRAHRSFVAGGEGLSLEMDATLFALIHFEQAGVYQEHSLDTVWGAGEGFVDYRFLAPRGVPKGVRVQARISSELPGAGDGLDPRDGSDVEVSLDGEVLGTVRARADDGLGEVVSVELEDARALRRIFVAGRRHTLRFRALPSDYAGGLCIYGKPTGIMALPDAAKRELDSVRITLR